MSTPEPSRPSLFRFKRLFRTGAGGTSAEPPAAGQRAARAVALCHALLSERGEVSGARLAHEALVAYRKLDEKSLRLFFDLLVQQFSPDPETVERCAAAYRGDPSQANLIALQHAVEPPRQELFRRLNMAQSAAPGSTIGASGASNACTLALMPRVSATSMKMSGSSGSAGWKNA